MNRETRARNVWIKRALIAAVAAFALYLAFGLWVLPRIIKAQIESKGSEALGREVALERASFNPFTLKTRLRGLSVADAEFGSLVSVELLAVNPQIFPLLSRTVELKEVTLTGLKANLAVNAGGTLSIDDILQLSSSAPATDEPADAGKPFRFVVRALLVENASLRLLDRSLAEPYEETVTLAKLEGVDIGTLPAEPSADAGSDFLHWSFLGSLQTASGATLAIDGGATSIDPWAFRLRARADGIDFASFNPYVNESVAARVAGKLGFEFAIEANLPTEGEPELKAQGGIAVLDFALRDDARDYLSFAAFSIASLSADSVSRSLEIDGMNLDSLRGLVALDKSGALTLPEFRASESAPATSEAPAGEDGALPEFRVKVSNSGIRGGLVHISDATPKQPFESDVSNIDLLVRELVVESASDLLEGSGSLTLGLSALGGKVQASAELASLSRKEISGTLALDKLLLANLQPYLESHVQGRLAEGAASASAKWSLAGESDVSVAADAQLDSVKFANASDGRVVVSFDQLSLDGVTYGKEGIGASVVALKKPYLQMWKDESGLNLERIVRVESDANEAKTEAEALVETAELLARAEAEAAAAVSESSIQARIDAVTIEDGNFEFLDNSVFSPHRTRLTGVSVSLNNLSTDEANLSDFDFAATINGSARLQSSGRINPLLPERFADVTLLLNGYDMTSISPYWEEYISRRLAKGQFRLQSKISIRESQLDSSTDFYIDQLTQGEAVDNPDAPLKNMPVAFAIGLMKDANGMISEEGFKVSGDLSDPEVGFMSLVWKALGNFVLAPVKAPFKFLAGLVGGREDIQTVDFQIGSVTLDADALEKAEVLAKAFAKRPALKVEIASNLNRSAETANLKRKLLVRSLQTPDTEIVSGLDLLATEANASFELLARQAYDELLAESEPPAGEAIATETVAAEPSPQVKHASENKPGILTRLARFVGLRRAPEASSTSEAARSENVETPSADDGAADSSVEAPTATLDQVVAELVSTIPDDAIKPVWLKQIATERASAFAAMLVELGVDPSRVFVVEAASDSTDSPQSQLQLNLTD